MDKTGIPGSKLLQERRAEETFQALLKSAPSDKARLRIIAKHQRIQEQRRRLLEK